MNICFFSSRKLIDGPGEVLPAQELCCNPAIHAANGLPYKRETESYGSGEDDGAILNVPVNRDD